MNTRNVDFQKMTRDEDNDATTIIPITDSMNEHGKLYGNPKDGTGKLLPMCTSTRKGWMCTLIAGHPGIHIGYGMTKSNGEKNMYAIWTTKGKKKDGKTSN